MTVLNAPGYTSTCAPRLAYSIASSGKRMSKQMPASVHCRQVRCAVERDGSRETRRRFEVHAEAERSVCSSQTGGV